MNRNQETLPGGAGSNVEDLYAQLAEGAARLMVVHETGRVLRTTHEASDLAKELLATVAEALFSGTGCVAVTRGEELDVLATHGLGEAEAEGVTTSAAEAGRWYQVIDSGESLRRPHAEARGGAGERVADVDDDADDDAGDAEDVDDAGDDTADAGEPWAGDDEATDDEATDDEATADEEDDAEVDGEDVLGADEEDDADAGGDDDPWSEDEDSAADEETVFELYVPLVSDGETIGVLALGPRVDGRAFADADVLFAESLAGYLALGLSMAGLVADKARRIEQLNTLLDISREITSTLDIEKVLSTLAQMMTMIVTCRRAAVALVVNGAPVLRASSEPDFNPNAASADPLAPVLRWALEARVPVNVSRGELEEDEEAVGRSVLLPYLSREGGPRGVFLAPLRDDQGVLGHLVIDGDADRPPVGDDDDELVTILANQATVALRNAELYQRVPMINVLEPLLKKKRGDSTPSRSRRVRLGVAAALLVLGALLPLPTWVAGDAAVRPARLADLRAPNEGIVEDILVREGQRVQAGEILGRLRREELEVHASDVRARAERLEAEAAHALLAGDMGLYSARVAELDLCAEELRFIQERLEETVFLAPADGIVLTERVERLVGARLGRGETLLQLADLDTMEVDVLVSEVDVLRLTPGSDARLKVYSHPGRTFVGRVARLAPRADEPGMFRVVLLVDQAGGDLKPGMSGRAHIETPARPMLVNALGPVVRWFRLRFWV